MGLSGRLKLIREELGYTQKAMAKTLNCSLSALQFYEAGSSVPGGNVLEALARLGFNVNWILTGEEEMRRGTAIRDLEDTYFQIPFRDELQVSVTWALIELATPGIAEEKAHRYAGLSLEAMNLLGQGREAVPPIHYIRRIARLVATLYDFYESDSGDSDVSGVVTNRITKLMEKIATKGKEKGRTNEEERAEILKLVNEIGNDEGK